MSFRKNLSFIILFCICFFCTVSETYASWNSINKGITNTGNISTLAFNPSNNAHILAGADKDGLYQSEDGGKSWRKNNNSIFQNVTFASLVFNPLSPNIIYVATRENGLFQSIDQGQTWQFILKPDLFLNNFKINKQNPNEMYLVSGYSNGGVLKSKDGGKIWFKITNTLEEQFFYRNIVIDPYNSNHLYLETISRGDFGGRIYETYDEGAHWQRILINVNNSKHAYLYNAEFPAPGIIYVSGIGGFFKNINNGKTWTPLFLTNNLITSFITNPKNPNEFYLYVEKEGIYHTTDNGANWKLIHPAFFSDREDFVKIESNPDHTGLLVSGPGIGLSSSTDGKTFTPIDDGIENIEVTALAVDPVNSKRQYVGIKDHGLWETENGQWQFSQFTHADIKNILVNPKNPAHVVINVNSDITNIYTTIYTSDIYGKNWRKAEVEKNDNYEFVPSVFGINPADPREIFADTRLQGTSELVLWKSNDGGRHWFYFSKYTGHWPDDGAVNISQFAINSKNPLEMYIGSTNIKGRMIYKSKDGGKTWQLLNYSFGPDAVNRNYNYTQALAIDPSHPDILYAATLTGLTADDLHLFKTTDGGNTWAKIGGDLPKVKEINSIIVDPANSNRVYVGTTQGIYISINGGINWQPLNDGLTNLDINSFVHSQNNLYAGTRGSGIFVTDK